MKHTKLLYFFDLIFITVLFTTNLANAESLTVKNVNCVCKADVIDPLEEPISFNFGKFKGQCVDSCRFRSARILYNQTDTQQPSPNEIRIGNILHIGIFREALIPFNNLQYVEAGFEEFMPSIYHVFLKFQFDEKTEPIKLINQVNPKAPVIETHSLVISPEAVPAVGHKFSLFGGYMGDFLLAIRVISWDEMQSRILKTNRTIKLFKLNLSKAQALQLFIHGIDESNKLRLENNYFLFSNNCSTTSLNLLDFILNNGKKTSLSDWTRFEEALPISGPFGTLHALKKRKLVKEQNL
jgi:hypothetical protein